VSGLPASFPDFLGNLSLAFESLIDTPEGAHHFRRVSLICLKVLRFCVYEHLRQRMSTLGGAGYGARLRIQPHRFEGAHFSAQGAHILKP
jgi:hypothetical protein